MAVYRIAFDVRLEREIEVPDGTTWSEAYRFARDIIGFEMLSLSPACHRVERARVVGFNTPEYLAECKRT